MRIFAPTYYKDFKCIADKCRHNCCIGWEIDIDEATLRRYRNDDGIMNKVSLIYTPHFVLGEDERCPFLGNDNLCEIIKQHGEGYLCQICRDHPRFYNEFDSRTEVGIGLTCEAAARLIIDNDLFIEEIAQDEELSYSSVEEKDFFEQRDEIFQSRPSDYKYLLPNIMVAELARLFKELERLDPEWDDVLDRHLDRYDKIHQTDVDTQEATRLFHYFVFRHLHKYGLPFCVLCTYFILSLDGDIYEIARQFSSEIEYSDQNIDALIEEVLL